MKLLKRCILALLIAALLLGLMPVFGADRTPDYTRADEIFNLLYRSVSGRKAAMTDAARADAAERLLVGAEGVTPGSVRRVGDEVTWMTEDGVACRFSPYLYSLVTRSGTQNARAPEPPRKAATSGGRDVCLFAPYYGMDDDFEGVGGSYDTWAAILARFTGGQYRRYEGAYATIDQIARAVESCAVVMIDSHGETDAQYRSSYICLHTGAGITGADYAYDPRAGVSHAYYGGRGVGGSAYYQVDGTAIANHMRADSLGCLFWNGTCYGMATRGICDPLIARGAGAVYGYSRDVSFGGDRCWMETFMDALTAGNPVSGSLYGAKIRWGHWDFSPQICARYGWEPWQDETVTEAIANQDAFPVLVSSQDPYPANPNEPQTVFCEWRLPRVDLYVRTHVPDGVKCPDILGFMFYEGRMPTPGGIPRDESRSYRFVGWSLYPVEPTTRMPTVYAPGLSFRFGYDDGAPLSFGDQSVDLYAVYAYAEGGATLYTTQVPDGPYDPYDPSALFSDMPYGTWYYQNVRYAVANGLVNGYTDGTFLPENTIRRSEVVSILYRAAGSPAAAEPAGFGDVKDTDWFAPAVAWAVERGIVQGYDDGLFHPERPVTRAQLAVFFCRFDGAAPDSAAALDVFPDRAAVPDWAAKELAWAVEHGLVNGSAIGGKNYLQPLNPATRAQFVAILNRYLDNSSH